MFLIWWIINLDLVPNYLKMSNIVGLFKNTHLVYKKGIAFSIIWALHSFLDLILYNWVDYWSIWLPILQ